MSYANITVFIKVKGNIEDIVEAAEDLKAAIYDHFKPSNYMVEIRSGTVPIVSVENTYANTQTTKKPT